MHCRMCSYIAGLYPLGTSSAISPPTSPFSSDNQKCPQTLPNVPKEAKSLLAENHCYINVVTIIIGQRQFPRIPLVAVEVVKHPPDKRTGVGHPCWTVKVK